jgi:hypothetical protein
MSGSASTTAPTASPDAPRDEQRALEQPVRRPVLTDHSVALVRAQHRDVDPEEDRREQAGDADR